MEKDKKLIYKYCIVPMCKNTIRNSPDKLFFLVPRGADIRRKWCENMKRHMVAPSTCLYCCEDHFNIKEDTDNYVEYQIMTSQMKQKTTLRLKKGILPHKFDCQKDRIQPPLTCQRFQKRILEITENSLSKKSAHTNISLQNKYSEPSTSTSLSHTLIHTEDIGMKSICEDSGCSSLPYEASTSTSLSHTLIHTEDIGMKSICEDSGCSSLPYEASTSTSLSHTLIHTEDIGMKSICEDSGCSSLPYEASTSTSLSHTLIHTEDIGMKSICEDSGCSSLPYEASTNTSSSHTLKHREEFEKKSVCEASCNPSLSNTKYVDKAIQVKSKIHYRSKGVNVNITAKRKNIAVSPFAISSKTVATSPVKIASRSGFKRRLFQDNSADIVSVSSAQPSVSSSSLEPEISSPGSSLVEDLDSETRFKNQMRCCMLTAIEKEPKMMIGLPKKTYYLIKLLSDTIPLPTVDILITLKKIKLNESFSILALQFGYTQSTISRIFSKSILLLAEKMKELIIWPTPADIFKKLPISFRARYSNVVSIIDCLEIQIEKPTNAVHQSLTWSQYKKCNTLKYLISCTPDGLVNFISVGYGGRASDVAIVEDCGFLGCLTPKTAIMADRGFKDISHLLTKKDCILIRPPSVFKSAPSTKTEVKQSKRIAALRIHVERVINRLREFHMLLPHACIDHNIIPSIDEVILVACGLINMQDVLIKK